MSLLNKLIRYLKINYPLFIVLVLFSVIVLPSCFINNEYINLVIAEHIDSGSTLDSILKLFNYAPNSFYNQNIPYTTGYYGFPFSSLLFCIFGFYKLIHISAIDQFSIFAATARLFNFIIAIFIIINTYFLSQKFIKKPILNFLLLISISLFPPFIFLSYHIKTDLLGLLLTLISLRYLYDFISNHYKNPQKIIIANILGGIAILCKQPFIFVIVPLLLGFLYSIHFKIIKRFSFFVSVYLKSLVIFLLMFFLIHPYAFIQFPQFLNRQIQLGGLTSASINQNISTWFNIYWNHPYLLLIIIFPILYLIYFLFTKNIHNQLRKNKNYLLFLAIYIISYCLWLTLKVGPNRVDIYLLPIFIFSLILFLFVIQQLIVLVFNHYHLFPKLLLIFITLIPLGIYIISSIFFSFNYINSSYQFQNSPGVLFSKQLPSLIKNPKSLKLIFSTSLPVATNDFQQASNDWQFSDTVGINNFHPNLLFIDFIPYWEKPYSYWQDVAHQNGLNQEFTFIKNTPKEKNIILFYK